MNIVSHIDHNITLEQLDIFNVYISIYVVVNF